MKKNILFICTHNSARSQMAEGFLNTLSGDRYEGVSAGIQPGKLNPYVVKAMAEVGIDISKNRTKSIEEFRGRSFDYVVTVCNKSRDMCPFFPGTEVIHKNFDDPSTFKGPEKEILEKVRLVRNEIKNWIDETFGKTLETE